MKGLARCVAVAVLPTALTSAADISLSSCNGDAADAELPDRVAGSTRVNTWINEHWGVAKAIMTVEPSHCYRLR